MKSLLFLLEGNNLKIPKSGERELCTIRAAQIRSDKGSYLALGISFQKDGNLDTCRSKPVDQSLMSRLLLFPHSSEHRYTFSYFILANCTWLQHDVEEPQQYKCKP